MIHVIDWREDFDNPELGIKIHYWNKTESATKEYYVEPHSHNFYEFFIITSGTTMHYFNKSISKLNVGDVLLIRPGDVHGFKQIQNENCAHINIGITSDRLKELSNFLENDNFDFINNINYTKFNLEYEEFEYFNHLASYIINSNINNNEIYAMLLKNFIINLITNYRKHYIRHDETQPQWFSELIYKLHTPEFLDIGAIDVYKMAKYSPAMANKYFKEYTGLTVNEYLRQIKLNYAKSALLKTNYTSLIISMQIGFDSLSYFNKIFKKETGLTPQQYRIKYKNIKI